MDLAYVILASVTAAALFYAAYMNFAGLQSVVEVADRVQVSTTMMVPFGLLLAAGATGLLVGFAVPVLGTAAAIGVVVYFVCALGAHVRVGDFRLGGAAAFLALAVATLVLGLAEHGPS